ncbi:MULTISPECIES: DUF5133 domain-containing protein [unclassified Streptomyces]|uniref:DUF5133 domain-containing protein n=2 Tax=unclassified Streptomyces TaxID=2593676 RepID=A0AB39M7P8_9ACTN|nr:MULTISPECIES: DUF5133 domain-containing protein [unclassified Streptomyces]MCX4816088.1 DUF5133 domain-containing protein [Streptomyces sp. NBC_01239]
MLVPDPKVVRKLLTRYAVLRISEAERQHPQAAAELNDVVYTLCVMMGTTGIREAIVKADALLAAARSTPKTVIADGRAAAA